MSPLPEGADPEALPPPPGTVLPGKPLPPLRAVVRVSAMQMQDAAGHPLVGLSASLLQSTNISAPPPGAAGNPAALGRDLSGAKVQSAIAAVRAPPRRPVTASSSSFCTCSIRKAHHERHRSTRYPATCTRTPHLYIAGLGLQTVTQITREVQDACRRSAEILYVDTGIATPHVSGDAVPSVTPLFDESYARDASRVSAYHHMAAHVVEAALDHPPVTFALHGHPLVAVAAAVSGAGACGALDLRVTILPGVWALDALLADLRLDPVVHGIQMYEATDVLLRRRPLQSDVPAILWQIGPLETCLHSQAVSLPARLRGWLHICGNSIRRGMRW